MCEVAPAEERERRRALWASTVGFTARFAIWTIFSIIGLAVREKRCKRAERESAAVIGFTSAIAAYGASYIPKAYGLSIEQTGTANAALWSFLIFYVTCAALTWFLDSGPRGILRHLERGSERPRKPSTA